MINLHLTKITKLFDLENLELYTCVTCGKLDLSVLWHMHGWPMVLHIRNCIIIIMAKNHRHAHL